MQTSSETKLKDLRRGIRGSLDFHNDSDIWGVKYACAIFGMVPYLKRHPEKRRKQNTEGCLGLDLHEDKLAAEFNALKDAHRRESVKFMGISDKRTVAEKEHYIAELDPRFHEHVFCRPEVTLALSVVALEIGMNGETLRRIVPDIRQHLEDAVRIAALQDRFPDITDKRVKKAVKGLEP